MRRIRSTFGGFRRMRRMRSHVIFKRILKYPKGSFEYEEYEVVLEDFEGCVECEVMSYSRLSLRILKDCKGS